MRRSFRSVKVFHVEHHAGRPMGKKRVIRLGAGRFSRLATGRPRSGLLTAEADNVPRGTNWRLSKTAKCSTWNIPLARNMQIPRASRPEASLFPPCAPRIGPFTIKEAECLSPHHQAGEHPFPVPTAHSRPHPSSPPGDLPGRMFHVEQFEGLAAFRVFHVEHQPRRPMYKTRTSEPGSECISHFQPPRDC